MEVLQEEDIEQLVEQRTEPCISLYMAIPPAAENRIKKMTIEFKNLLKDVREQLKKDWGFDSRQIDELLEQAEKLGSDRAFWQNQSAGLAVFISPETFIFHKAPLKFKDKAVVSKYFNIKQLIPEIRNNQEFYILALSQNQNRVYECTRGSFEEIEIEGVPGSIGETLQWDDPERSIQYHTHRGSGSEAFYHGQGVTDRDNEEDLLRYLRQINQGLHAFLNDKTAPLVVVSVEELFPLYERANTYPHLMEQSIKGNPESFKAEEIHSKAWELVKPGLEGYKEELIDEFFRMKKTDKVSGEIDDIIPAAYYSKVDTLLLRDGTEQWGSFNSEKNEVKSGENLQNDYDLFNFAAVQTLLNGGEVYVLDNEEMPDELQIGAIYRY